MPPIDADGDADMPVMDGDGLIMAGEHSGVPLGLPAAAFMEAAP